MSVRYLEPVRERGTLAAAEISALESIENESGEWHVQIDDDERWTATIEGCRVGWRPRVNWEVGASYGYYSVERTEARLSQRFDEIDGPSELPAVAEAMTLAAVTMWESAGHL